MPRGFRATRYFAVFAFGIVFVTSTGLLQAADSRAAQLGQALLASGLDTAACYRVRDLSFTQEDAQFFSPTAS
jgi:hypothetical protein